MVSNKVGLQNQEKGVSKEKMKTGFSYCRVSTDEQVEKYGLPSQLDAIRKYAKDHDIEIVREYSEEGVSGTTIDRPELNRLKADMVTDRPDCILFYDVSRMSRDLLNQLNLCHDIEALGVKIEFAQGGEKEDTPEGELFFQIRGSFAEFERKQTLEKSRRGRNSRMQSGLFMGGAACRMYGYDYSEGKRVINETGKVVKQIYTWYLEGRKVNEIVTLLKASNVPSPSGQAIWSRFTIVKMLRNRAYTGTATFNGIELTQPALISEADFEAAQLMLKRKQELATRHQKHDYLLAGFIFCDACNHRYIGHIVRPNGTRYYYCGKSSKRQQYDPCTNRAINATSLETMVWLEVEKVLTNPRQIMAMSAAQDTSGYEKELETLQASLKHWKAEYQKNWQLATMTGDFETHANHVKRIKKEVELVETRISEVQPHLDIQAVTEQDIKAALGIVSHNLGNLTNAEKREILQLLKIRIRKGEGIAIEGTLPVEHIGVTSVEQRHPNTFVPFTIKV